MQEVYDQIQRVAPTAASVFIVGSTGTGKALVAETVHALSRRSAGPFVPMNCGAMSHSLIESELFGHERGSVTGATQHHTDLWERAAGGSLFLDEITAIPIDLQGKLLRALESRRIQRVGSDSPLGTDVRLIAATNRDPQRSAADGVLRKDLLDHFLVFPIRLPSLSQRQGDVDLIATHFLNELNRSSGTAKRFTEDALELLRRYSWPGNLRELRNVVERSYFVSGDRIDAQSVPLQSETAPQSNGRRGVPVDGLGIQVGMSIAQAERILLIATLEKLEGNKRRAAEQLGISLKTLYNRLNSYGIL
jgi:DNA-binding NtrC family response regulator